MAVHTDGASLQESEIRWNQHMRVLIADDNRDAAMTLAHLVEAWGYEPSVRHDGIGALAWLRTAAGPHIALLDWNMPGMDGVELCERVRKDNRQPYVYVMLVTGRGERQQMLDGLNAGADDYVVKPFDPSELRARLNTGRRILRLQEKLLATQRQLHERATHDALTGMWNRRAILELVEREAAKSQRTGTPLTVLLADIDHFKEVNDTHGHLVGDRVLRQAALMLQQSLRPYDMVGRYGGEEFLVLLSGCDRSSAQSLSERCRAAIEANPDPIPVTISMGVATWDQQSPIEQLLRRADAALYRAKRDGRNRTVVAD